MTFTNLSIPNPLSVLSHSESNLSPTYLAERGKWKFEKLDDGKKYNFTSFSTNTVSYNGSPTAMLMTVSLEGGLGIVFRGGMFYVGNNTDYYTAEIKQSEETITVITNDPSIDKNIWGIPVGLTKNQFFAHPLVIIDKEYDKFLTALCRSSEVEVKVPLSDNQVVTFKFDMSGFKDVFMSSSQSGKSSHYGNGVEETVKSNEESHANETKSEYLQDGVYKAEWSYRGTWYSIIYEIKDLALKYTYLDEYGERITLKSKLAHKEYVKALKMGVPERDFYFQFSIPDKKGYMTIKGIREDISVSIVRLSNSNTEYNSQNSIKESPVKEYVYEGTISDDIGEHPMRLKFEMRNGEIENCIFTNIERNKNIRMQGTYLSKVDGYEFNGKDDQNELIINVSKIFGNDGYLQGSATDGSNYLIVNIEKVD